MLTSSVRYEVKKTVSKWQAIKTNHIQTNVDYFPFYYIFFQSIVIAFTLDLSVLKCLAVLPSPNIIIIFNPGTKHIDSILF